MGTWISLCFLIVFWHSWAFHLDEAEMVSSQGELHFYEKFLQVSWKQMTE